MKALSFTQPWAMLVIWMATEDVAEKEYETRSWRWTPKPGEILIHAAKGFPRWARDLCYENPYFRHALARHGHLGPQKLPLGAIVGKATITVCHATENIRDRITEKERQFGDYSTGRLAIRFNHQKALSTPVPCTGALGIWTVPPEVERLVKTQLTESV
jgi:activating signal cointegrator 1